MASTLQKVVEDTEDVRGIKHSKDVRLTGYVVTMRIEAAVAREAKAMTAKK